MIQFSTQVSLFILKITHELHTTGEATNIAQIQLLLWENSGILFPENSLIKTIGIIQGNVLVKFE